MTFVEIKKSVDIAIARLGDLTSTRSTTPLPLLAAMFFESTGTTSSLMEELIESSKLKSLNIRDLNSFSKRHIFDAPILAEQMLEIGYEKVLGTFGFQTLAWALITQENKHALFQEIVTKLSSGGISFNDAIESDPQLRDSCRITDFKIRRATAYLAQDRFPSQVPAETTSSILRANLRDGVSGLGHPEKYVLESIYRDTRGNSKRLMSFSRSAPDEEQKRFGVGMSGEWGYLLLFKGAPNAVITFDVQRDGVVAIRQIQGIKSKIIDSDGHERVKSSRGLMPLNWNHALVDLVETRLSLFGSKRFCIQSADNNEWTRIKDPGAKEVHLPKEHARQIYDALAIQRGYRRNWLDRNFYLDVAR